MNACCLTLLLDGEHSAGFLNDLGVKIDDITFFEGKYGNISIYSNSKYQQYNTAECYLGRVDLCDKSTYRKSNKTC